MIDFQGLFAVLRAGEASEEAGTLKMRSWSCGTAGCLIGSFCKANPGDRLHLRKALFYESQFPSIENTELDGMDGVLNAISQRFGLSEREVKFLFTYDHLVDRSAKNANSLSGSEALARLRKFLYYKLHKQEMTLEEARRVDGNKAAVVAVRKAREAVGV